VVGERYVQKRERQASRWGKERGYCVIDGQKVPIARTRVRDKANREVRLGSYAISAAVPAGLGEPAPQKCAQRRGQSQKGSADGSPTSENCASLRFRTPPAHRRPPDIPLSRPQMTPIFSNPPNVPPVRPRRGRPRRFAHRV
jgi:hypothetical protein